MIKYQPSTNQVSVSISPSLSLSVCVCVCLCVSIFRIESDDYVKPNLFGRPAIDWGLGEINRRRRKQNTTGGGRENEFMMPPGSEMSAETENSAPGVARWRWFTGTPQLIVKMAARVFIYKEIVQRCIGKI